MSRQWTLPIELREFRPDDYGKLAKVFGSIFPNYDRTPEEWKFEDESLIDPSSISNDIHAKARNPLNLSGLLSVNMFPGCIIRRSSGSISGSIRNIRRRA